jgi:hypothetical protein
LNFFRNLFVCALKGAGFERSLAKRSAFCKIYGNSSETEVSKELYYISVLLPSDVGGGKIPLPEREPRKEIFMNAVEEKQVLDEMAIMVVSSPRRDGLPFRVAIKSPDHQPPHAHVMDLTNGKKEIGQFLISDNPPQKPEDIKDYKQGVTDDIRRGISDWAKRRNKDFPKGTNWEMLVWQWLRNEPDVK